MKSAIIFAVLSIFLGVDSFSQLTHLGLDSIRVNDLRYHDNSIYAGTIDSGVYQFQAGDSIWSCLGLKNRWINAVYPFVGIGGEFSLLAGVYWYARERDSISIYSYKDGNFNVADSGISHKDVDAIYSIDGLNGTIMVGGDIGIYRRLSSVWEPRVWFIGNDVKISRDGTIWVVGADMFWTVAVIRSNDNGDTWRGLVQDFSLDPWDSWYIGSIAIDPKNSNRAYVTSGRAIVKTDSAYSDHPEWERLFFCDQELSKIAVDPFDGDHLFAGGEHFQLYESTNAGNSWQPITPIDSGNTISDIEIPETEMLTLYISTSKNGIYQMKFPDAGYRMKCQYSAGWNFISLPVRPKDLFMPNIFPSAISKAFSFEGYYVIHDTLVPGKGYWVKFDRFTTKYFIGEELDSLEIDVSAGWNVIGALSKPISKATIGLSSGLEIGTMYTYSFVYLTAMTLNPGMGYWVKTNQSGKIILEK